MTDEQWSLVLDVTLNGCFRCTRAALKHMLPRKSGVIVNNASVLGWRAQEGQGHYAAAKAGVMALTRCAAIEAAEAGVRVNAVSPSLAMHPFLSKVTPQGLLDDLTKREAFGRAAETFEVAKLHAFQRLELAAEDQVQQLLLFPVARHRTLLSVLFPSAAARAANSGFLADQNVREPV